MSEKKSSSNLPSGPFDLGAGSSYGMDTLTPLLEREEGILDHARLPEAKGLSGLPDGIISPPDTGSSVPDAVTDVEHIVLGNLNEDIFGGDSPRTANVYWFEGEAVEDPDSVTGGTSQTPSLTDLTWLQEAEQDPARLPKKPNIVSDLVEQWGVGRRTDGVHFYNDKIQEPVKSKLPIISVPDLARSAIRIIASGGDASEQLNQLPANIKNAVQSEIGLNGKVYIRADAYPKCDSGRWSESIQKTASSAEYIIQKSACAGCVRNNQGTCGSFQKRLVAEVPWDSAYKKYANRLKIAGKVLPEGNNNPRETLKKAFLAPSISNRPVTAFPVVSVAEISAQEASKQLRELKREAEVISKVAIEYKSRKNALQQKLEKWVDGRYITLSQMKGLLESKADPTAIMKVAAHLADANMVQSGKYSNPEGLVKTSTLTHDEAWSLLKEAEDRTLKDNNSLKTKVASQTKAYIKKFASSGLITPKEAEALLSNPSIKDALTKLSSIVSTKLSSKADLRGNPDKIGSYSGVGLSKKVPSSPSNQQISEYMGEKIISDKTRDEKVKLYIHTKQASAAHNYLNQLKNAGVLSEDSIKTLDLNAPSDVLLSKVADLINKTNLNKKAFSYQESNKNLYSGDGLDTLFGSDYSEPDLDSALSSLQSSQRTIYASPNEIRGVLKWAVEHMHSGSMGKELDTLLSTRFAPGLLKAASGLLNLEREKHEGLAGVVYIDASHYATSSGTTGCDKGGLIHRASSIKHVLKMERCASCVFKNANNTCQKYNKTLVSKAPVSNPEEYQKEMIRQANSSDQEQTQQLFNTSNILEEYHLQKDANSSDLDLMDAPEYQNLEGVVFGDFDLE
jgi:hypothetical protein